MALLCSECPNKAKPGTRGSPRVTCSALCAKNRKNRLLREKREAKRKGEPAKPKPTWREKIRSVKFTDSQKALFFEKFIETNRVYDSSQYAGVHINTIGVHKKKDPEFASQFVAAERSYADSVRSRHQRLMTEGIIRRKFDRNGNMVEEYAEIPIKLIEMELKATDKRYRDKQEIEVKDASGVFIAPKGVAPADWVAHQEEQNKKRETPASVQAEEQEKEQATESPKESVLVPN